MSDALISVVLPVYNQADHIVDIVEKYEAAMTRVVNPHEFVLVVNNSRDESLTMCQGLAEKYESVKVVHSEAGGWGLAVNLGLKHCTGDIICYANSARTSPEDLVLILLYAVANPGSVVKANRYVRENFKRRVGSLLYNIEVRALFDLPYWDVNGTPKAFPREFDKLLALECNNDLIDAEFNAVCREERYPLLEVPIMRAERHSGVSTTTIRSAFKLYWGVYQLWRERRDK
jgi:glycosyltransferase involved in cell wall biosynthesis